MKKKYDLNENIFIVVTTGLVGKTFLWTDPYAKFPTMNVDQLKEMIAFGCQIASHGVTHRAFCSLSQIALEWELKTSKEWIIKNLGVTPTIFVAPFDICYQEQEEIAKTFYQEVRKPEPNSVMGVSHTGIRIHYVVSDKDSKLFSRWGLRPDYNEVFRNEKLLRLRQKMSVDERTKYIQDHPEMFGAKT
jgi:peptidoglycan/xylan/chitin deacetylase (PgdA/CDA1 family)